MTAATADGVPAADDRATEGREPGAGRADGRAAVAGAVAAAAALGAGELVAGIGGTITGRPQSLVASVGVAFIDRAPGEVSAPAIDAFGTADKAALLVGIVAVCGGLGAVLGRLAPRHLGRAVAGFVAFAGLGIVAGWSDPLADRWLTAIAGAAAALAGVSTLVALQRAARVGSPLPPARRHLELPTDPASTRRGFFAWSGAAAAFAVTAAAAGRSLRRDDRVEQARAAVTLPEPEAGTLTAPDGLTEVDGLSPFITPNDDFYRIDTALIVPQIDPAGWQLEIGGLVERPVRFTYEEILAMPTVSETVTIACVSNEVGDDLVGNAVWQGVPLGALLERAGVRPEAEQLVGTSADGWTCGFPVEAALDGRTALLAVGMNGEPLPVRHGFPARVVVAGLYGYVSATKWVTRLDLTRWDDVDGYWIPRGWAKEAPIKTQSRIDVPRPGRTLDPGPTPIAGVAWAPTRGITEVEVQVDGGEWMPAELGPTASDESWVQWMLVWDAPPGPHTIRVRATDGDGRTQTAEVRPPAPDGATGWHTRQVQVGAV